MNDKLTYKFTPGYFYTKSGEEINPKDVSKDNKDLIHGYILSEDTVVYILDKGIKEISYDKISSGLKSKDSYDTLEDSYKDNSRIIFDGKYYIPSMKELKLLGENIDKLYESCNISGIDTPIGNKAYYFWSCTRYGDNDVWCLCLPKKGGYTGYYHNTDLKNYYLPFINLSK